MDVEAYRRRLEDRRDELRRRLGRIEADLDTEPPKDWEDRATEREGDEVLEDLGSAGLQELRMIEAALARVAAGEYGVCVACGAAISEERLAVVPHAPRCRHCA